MADSVSLKGFLYEWKIENPLSDVRRDSEEFDFQENRCKLNLEINQNSLIITLSITNSEKRTRGFKTVSFIQDIDNNLVHGKKQDFFYLTFATLDVWCIEKNYLQQRFNEYLINGTMMFFIIFSPTDEIKQKTEQKDKFSQTSCSMDTVACLENLSHDLQHLMGDRSQSDMTLNCEGRSFSAHKAILSARSPVFSAMFQSDMAESRTKIVEITDMNASDLHQFLLYIYSGKLSDLSVDSVPELYAAADKYEIESLKKLCAKFMKENLTRESACKFLVTADVYGDKEIKECVLNFITDIKLFLDENIWFAFHDENPKLASEALHHAYKTKCFSKEQ